MIKKISKVIISRIRHMPYKLNLVVTNRCNSKCVHCNVWKQNTAPAKTSELSLDEFDKIFKNLPKHLIWLAITGGEPTLREDLFQIIKSAKKNIDSLSIVSIVSNGLDTKRLIQLTKNLQSLRGIKYYITLSLDGPEPIHDKIRGVKGAYKKVIQAYEGLMNLSLPNKQFRFSLETTISKDNINYLYDFLIDNVKTDSSKRKHFIFTLFHNAYVYNNWDIKKKITINDYAEVKKIIGLIKSGYNHFSPENFIQNKYLSKCLDYIKFSRVALKCRALADSFTLSALGDIYPCSMWEKKLGNIRDYGYNVDLVWNSKIFNDARKKIKSKKCPGCWTPCEAYQSIISSLCFFE